MRRPTAQANGASGDTRGEYGKPGARSNRIAGRGCTSITPQSLLEARAATTSSLSLPFRRVTVSSSMPGRPRVLHVVWTLDMGGTERAVFQLVSAQRRQGIHADVAVGHVLGFY